MKKDQRGLVHLALLLFAVIIVALAAVGYRVYTKNADKVADQPSATHNEPQNATEDDSTNCQPAKAGLFTSDVTNVDDIILIQNPIRVVGGNNIKTHSYIEVSKKSPVYAPMDAELNGGANYYETMGPQPVTKVQYILAFNGNCDVNFWLDHLVDVPDKIKAAFPAEARDDTQAVEVKKTQIKAGELVGYSNQAGRARFDFGVVNMKGPETSLTTNPRFKDNPLVKTSDKYRYATCPYNLYDSTKLKTYQSLYDSTADSDQDIIDNICE